MHLDPMIFDEHSLRNFEVLDSKNTTFGILYSPLTKQHFPLYYIRKLIESTKDLNPRRLVEKHKRYLCAVPSLPQCLHV